MKKNNSQTNIRIEESKNRWIKRGFKVDLLTGVPGEAWQSKGHEADEVLIFLEGEADVFFQGKTYYPSIGEEFIIPAKVPHTFKVKTFCRYYFLMGLGWEKGDVGKPLDLE
ncbi:MAG: hypothetical protein WBM44_09535 [Waterburya sp.]